MMTKGMLQYVFYMCTFYNLKFGTTKVKFIYVQNVPALQYTNILGDIDKIFTQE